MDVASDDGSDADGGSEGLESEVGCGDPPRLSNQERLRLAKRRRAEQLRLWTQREREWKKVACSANGDVDNTRIPGGGKGVLFEPSIVLLEAAARNDLEEVRNLLELGVSPDSTNEDGLTALHQCCIDDSEEMMKILIDYGGNPNATDTEKWTPLHAAATCGHLHLVKFLIDSGADLLSVNADGNMPYDLCEDETTLSYIENEMARRGVTQELIDDTRSETEQRMLHDLQTLQMNGGDLDFKDAYSNASPLHIASANGFLSVVEFLLEHHVSTEVEDEDLWQPIHAAACWGHLEIVELLAQNGANLSAKTRNGESPLDICEDPDIKERLIQLKEQRLLFEQPRVRRSRSASTRTQSIRRTSLRDKMNTTKRDVQDEKLYLMQSFDNDKDMKPGVNKSHEKINQNHQEVVNVHDVELTLLPAHLPDSAVLNRGSVPDRGSTQSSPPYRPQRSNGRSPTDGTGKSGQFVNRVLLSNATASSSTSSVSTVKVSGSALPTLNQPSSQHVADDNNSQIVSSLAASGSIAINSPHFANVQSQTLSDLKKKRSMSRVNLPSPQQTSHAQNDSNLRRVGTRLSPQTISLPSGHSSSNDLPPASNVAGKRNNSKDRTPNPGKLPSKMKAHRSENPLVDEDRVHVDNTRTKKFVPTNSGTAHRPSIEKTSCCKLM